MAKIFEALRGMEDLLPGEIEKWQWLEEKARVYFESRGFKEIRTPVLEYTDLFSRSVGEASDIVHKEMFSFEDRGGRHVSLRPEMTASVARAVIEKGLLTQAKSLRFYYLGPMFRAERPQAGRKRQFHQIGIEILNEKGGGADFEVIRLLHDFLVFVGGADWKLRINDLGQPDAQVRTARELKAYFSAQKSKLCEDCRWRLEKNVLRIFDCKDNFCQAVIENAPWDAIAPLGPEFEALTQELRGHQIPFEIKRRLVRGLDYYNGAVFEVAAENLGAQDAIAGGGRYDRLYGELGGTSIPATGFSIGMERLLAVLEKGVGDLDRKIKNKTVYLAPLDAGHEVMKTCYQAALDLRQEGFRVEVPHGEASLSKHLKKANQLGMRFVLMIGTDEIAKKKWVLKDMSERKQIDLETNELVSYLKGVVAP